MDMWHIVLFTDLSIFDCVPSNSSLERIELNPGWWLGKWCIMARITVRAHSKEEAMETANRLVKPYLFQRGRIGVITLKPI